MSSSSSHPTVKIVFTPPFGQSMAEETRRVPSSALLPNQPIFNQLLTYLAQTYSAKYGNDARYLISYDDGEDVCVITSEEEIKEAIHVQGGKTLKIMVTVEEKSNMNTPLFSATPLAYQLSGASTPAPTLTALQHTTTMQAASLTSSLSSTHDRDSYHRLSAEPEPEAEAGPEPSLSLAPPSGVFPVRTDSQDSAVVLSDTESDDEGGYVRIEEDTDNQTEMSSQAGIKMIEKSSPAAQSVDSVLKQVNQDTLVAQFNQVTITETIDTESKVNEVEDDSTQVAVISPDASMILTLQPQVEVAEQLSVGTQSSAPSQAMSTQTESTSNQVDTQTQAITSTTVSCQTTQSTSTAATNTSASTIFEDYDVLLFNPDSIARYYRMQISHDGSFVFETCSGPTPHGGSSVKMPFGQFGTQAIDTFKDTFLDKTGVKWEERHVAEPVKGKYRLESSVPSVAPICTFTPAVTSESQFVHERITCDICHTSPIVGTRYKCTVCRDFDLCANCETANKHPSDHILMKIRAPLTNTQNYALDAEISSKKGRISLNPSAPFVSCISSNQRRPKAEFINDVTLADGSRVIAGEKIHKVFRVKNVGTEPWPVGTKLVFTGGDLMPSESQLNPQGNSVLVPYAGVNDIVNLSLDIIVPEIANEEERLRATFRLATADGTKFGPRIWIDIIAVNPNFKPVPVPVPVQAEEQKSAAPTTPPVTIPVAIPVRDLVAQAYADAQAKLKAQTLNAELAEAKAAEKAKADFKTAATNIIATATTPVPALPVESITEAKVEVSHVEQKEQVQAISPSPSSVSVSTSTSTSAAAPATTFKEVVAKAGASEPNFKYRNELASLRSMGFTDVELNKYLLNQHNGNVAKCVDWILTNSRS